MARQPDYTWLTDNFEPIRPEAWHLRWHDNPDQSPARAM